MNIDGMKFKVQTLLDIRDELCNKAIDYAGYLVFSVLGVVVSLGSIILDKLFGFDILNDILDDTMYDQSHAIITILIISSIGFFLIRAMKKNVDKKYLIATNNYFSALSELKDMIKKPENSKE
ncbi:MAG: hypothetical protein SPLUMA2_SPLUMAMAG2_01092 [uncultured Sulfurimonas sp.]|nr:MAG: hypothetical protein SPLUMA1_SPLUMAMAG1_01855 [uncultured Sulfurimonas sp.]CAI6163092.1 MAG: hypothetical protein SPLUMA2_SPLUMAMAG2_01092 [uncultured Sulfurimonas sp.]